MTNINISYYKWATFQDGELIKVKPVNPHPKSVSHYDDEGEYSGDILNDDWTRFEFKANHELTFTCIGLEANKVYEGSELELVWQFYDHNAGYEEWSDSLNPERDRNNGYRTRQVMCLKSSIADADKPKHNFAFDHLPLSKEDQHKLYWDSKAKEKLLDVMGIKDIPKEVNHPVETEAELRGIVKRDTPSNENFQKQPPLSKEQIQWVLEQVFATKDWMMDIDEWLTSKAQDIYNKQFIDGNM